MTVNIIFSSTSGGDSMADTQDSGSVSPKDESTAQDIYIRHDAVNAPITDCSWYITRCVSLTYLGNDPDEDLTEILGWGASATEGFMINQIDSGTAVWDSFRVGHGDINNQIILDEDAISIGTPAGDGVIPVAGEAHVQVKWVIPTSPSRGTGYRGLSLIFAYSATS
jgi:hypothetical protein